MSKFGKLCSVLMVFVAMLVCMSVFRSGAEENTLMQLHGTPAVSLTPDPTPTPTILLVNQWNPIPDDYSVDVRELPNGHRVAVACYDDLIQMLNDCAACGMNPSVCSGFRTINDQTALFRNKVERVMGEGHDRRAAEVIAATEVAYPGTSEHHTGLAVDIIDGDYPVLDETQEQRPTQQWLLDNSWRYGFILRYPSDKTELTGIIYEPWHYRYVGKQAAEEIYSTGICLEEYLQQ